MSLRRVWRDASFSAVTAGFLAVLVSYAGPLLIFLQAGQNAHASQAVMASWVWAISIGAGVSGILLSLWLRVPVATAWSAPGTALLAVLFPAMSLNEAVGAYLVAAAIILTIGMTGAFDKLMALIPKGVAAGMMAGIVFQFGAKAFKSVEQVPALGLTLIAVYIVAKRWRPREHLLIVLAIGVLWSMFGGSMPWSSFELKLTRPVWIEPHWSLGATLSLAIPLVVVSLSGQYLPGMAVLRGAGYDISASRVMTITSLGSLMVACFGGITIVLGAITAALCTGKDAHEQPERRYIAGLANGAFYVLAGSFSGAILWLFSSLPTAFVAILAGLALLGAIASNLSQAVHAADQRDAAILSFVVTASGMTWVGMGSAFWGVVMGCIAHRVWHRPSSA